MRIALFEDRNYHNFNPLVYLRPVFELRSGILLLRGKLEKRTDLPVDFLFRKLLEPLFLEQYPDAIVNRLEQDDYLFVNARAVINDTLFAEISALPAGAALLDGDDIIACHLPAGDLPEIAFDDEGLPVFPLDMLEAASSEHKLVSYCWDLTGMNAGEIIRDFDLIGYQGIKGEVYVGAHVLHYDRIFIDEGSKIYPGCVVSAENGPVYIGKNVTVRPNAVIEGPVYIGDESQISIGAKVYKAASIGPVCKMGGEVEASIIHSCSNKKHEGFLGHAYLGQWVNLGADSNNSDLKNNYGFVKSYAGGKEVNTGSRFVGMTVADHAKTGINTMINTGSVIGLMSNVFGAGFPPKFIPDFSWGGADGLSDYRIDKALEVARIVKQRRKQDLSEEEAKLIRYYFEKRNQ